jgi:hypothetical protein
MLLAAERIRVLLTSGWFLVIGLFLLHEHIVSRLGLLVLTRAPAGPVTLGS